MEKLDKLIKMLLEDASINCEIPDNPTEKYYLYKSLVNVRLPREISEDYLNLEDEYLQERLKGKVIDISNFPKKKIVLYKGDITKLLVDAIVNPGNEKGIGCFEPSHYCLDNVINTNAGMRLRLACNKIMVGKDYHLNTSECIITKGFNLPCKYVIETVGPIVDGKLTDREREELGNCYKNALDLARESGIKTIAFPCISTGIFNFPNGEAARVAYHTIKDYLDNNKDSFKQVIICTYKDIDYDYYKRLINEEGK